MVNNKHLVKIDKELINFLRLSYRCPGCMKQVILTPDISDKEYLTCGVCQHSIHIRYNQVMYLKELLRDFDSRRKILEMNGLQVWIEGQPDTSPLIPGSTTLKHTQYHSPL